MNNDKRIDKDLYTDCHFYNDYQCEALKEFYNDDQSCEGCPFFKTADQIEADKVRYKRK